METNQTNIIDGEFKVVKDDLAGPQVPAEKETLTRPKLKDKMEIIIKYGSSLTPGNVVLLGTGDINAKYRTWLENRFQQGLTSNDPSKKMTKERINLYFAVQSLCTMAVAEDEAEVVTYRWDGPAFKRKHEALNIVAVVEGFVKAKFDILYAIAPFFGVKINRVSSSSQASDVQEPVEETIHVPV